MPHSPLGSSLHGRAIGETPTRYSAFTPPHLPSVSLSTALLFSDSTKSLLFIHYLYFTSQYFKKSICLHAASEGIPSTKKHANCAK